MLIRIASLLMFLGLMFAPRAALATRVEEMCDVSGVRSNQLIGYGLVVGLANTGDTGRSQFTVQSTAAMLRRLGATVDVTSIQPKNAAAVVITATLPPFSAPGMRIDVTVSSLGNARSLLGGTLLQTPLFGADRKVYAVAQGPVLVGGFSASGVTGSSVSKNHLTVGRVPEGGLVERLVETPALSGKPLVLTLRQPSFVNAQRVVDAIDAALGVGTATALDGASIRVTPPDQYKKNFVGLLAVLSLVEVEPDNSARVVIDERTGTIVLGGAVRISEVAIAQGGLTIEIQEEQSASQPAPFTLNSGDTKVVPSTSVDVEQGNTSALHHVKATATLSDLVTALNAIGARPRDLIAIFQALRTAGALQARIEVQ